VHSRSDISAPINEPVIAQECRSAAVDLAPNKHGRSGYKVNDEK
jgi:hypothetical protein